MKTVRHAYLLVFLLAFSFVAGCNRGPTNSVPAQSEPRPASSVGTALVVQEANSPAGGDSREPDLYATPDGRIILSWVEKVGEKDYALRFAMRDAANWSEPRTVSAGSNWFVNWADFPSVIALSNGTLAAHWLVKSGTGTYAYDINISLSKDNGNTWSEPIVPHTDRTQTEHGFVSLLPLTDGRVGAAWIDGRNLQGLKIHEDDGPLPVSMGLRYAAIDAGGQLSDEALLDERICECCQTSAATTSEGPIAVYRDRSEGEVRDIFIVRRQNGKWSIPQPVHSDGWEVSACPVNGPSVAADGQRVAVAWYTEASNTPRVNVAFSNDAGQSFGRPIQVDDGNAVGRVDVVMLADGSALVCWLSGTAERGATKTRSVHAGGALGPVSIVAESDISRSSGFPRIARAGNEILFAWTEFGKPSRVRVATARFE